MLPIWASHGLETAMQHFTLRIVESKIGGFTGRCDGNDNTDSIPMRDMLYSWSVADNAQGRVKSLGISISIIGHAAPTFL